MIIYNSVVRQPVKTEDAAVAQSVERRIGSAEVTGPIPVSSSEERACEIEEISHAFLIHRKLRSLLNKNAPL